jgi:hypothetical protein
MYLAVEQRGCLRSEIADLLRCPDDHVKVWISRLNLILAKATHHAEFFITVKALGKNKGWILRVNS